MIIRWLDDAVHDLYALRNYIAQEKSSAANRIAKRIIKAINFLSEQPGIGEEYQIHENLLFQAQRLLFLTE